MRATTLFACANLLMLVAIGLAWLQRTADAQLAATLSACAFLSAIYHKQK